MLEDDVSFKGNVKRKPRPKVKIQDFHMTLYNDTWTVAYETLASWLCKLKTDRQVEVPDRNYIGHASMYAKQCIRHTLHALTMM